MFNTAKVGAYISLLRKSKKLTQGQLAEKLGVSHQAVSNWERGESMPDVVLLPDIASILGVSVDRLLASSGENFTGFDDIINDELIAAAPLAEPESDIPAPPAPELTPAPELDRAAEIEIEIADLRAEKEVREVRLKKMRAGLKAIRDKKHSRNLNDATIERLDQMIGETEERLDQMEGEIDEIAEKIVGLEEELETLNQQPDEEVVAEFEDMLDALADGAPPENSGGENKSGMNLKDIMGLAPFASAETLDKLVEKAEKAADFGVIRGLAPFLSSQTLDKLVEKAEQAADFGVIRGLAPFLSSQTLEKLLMKNIDAGINFSVIQDFAPFLSSGFIDSLIEKLK